MNINVICRNCEIKKHDHDYVVNKVENLSRFHIKIDHLDVIVKKEGHEYVLELILKAMHKDFLMKKRGSTVDEVIDILVDKMAHHLTKHKDKVKEHQREKIKEVHDQDPYTIVYKKRDDFEQITRKEAIHIVLNSNEKFLIYVDSSSSKLCFIVEKDGVIEIVKN